jgi:hypothetical protein
MRDDRDLRQDTEALKILVFLSAFVSPWLKTVGRNFLPWMMIRIIAFPLLLSVSIYASAQDFEKDFNTIAEVYEQQAMPYLFSFAEKQLAPLPVTASEDHKVARKREIESLVAIHKTYLEEYRKAGLEVLKQETTSAGVKLDRKNIVSFFDSGYRNSFLYLDYAYYVKCRKLVEELGTGR